MTEENKTNSPESAPPQDQKLSEADQQKLLADKEFQAVMDKMKNAQIDGKENASVKQVGHEAPDNGRDQGGEGQSR